MLTSIYGSLAAVKNLFVSSFDICILSESFPLKKFSIEISLNRSSSTTNSESKILSCGAFVTSVFSSGSASLSILESDWEIL